MRKIILLIGESGAGKTTIGYELQKQGFKYLKSYTTKPKLTDTNDHTYVTAEEFEHISDMVCKDKYGDYWYGATKEQIDDSDIYVINPGGARQFLQNYQGEKQALVVKVVTDRDEHKDFKNRYERIYEENKNHGMSIVDASSNAALRIARNRSEYQNIDDIIDVTVVNDSSNAVLDICNMLAEEVLGGDNLKSV